MSRNISRRSAIASIASAAGAFGMAMRANKAEAWAPGPDDYTPAPMEAGRTPIRLAMNIKREGNESPEEMIIRRRKAGFTATKGARHPGGNKGEPWHSMTMAEREEVVKACKKQDVIIYEVGGYTNLVTPSTTQLQKNLKALAHCMEVAESVNCRMVGTVSGCCNTNSLIGMHPDNWSPETWKRLVNSVKQVLKDTEGMKAVIGMEAQVTTNIDSPKAHKRLMNDVGSDRVKVNLDPNNMMSLARYYHSTELIDECFDLLGEDIYGCHAKDSYIIPDKQTVLVQEVCPGKGVMDYERYLIRMSHLGYPRALEPEHIPDEQYPEAIAYIRKIAKKVGVKIYGD